MFADTVTASSSFAHRASFLTDRNESPEIILGITARIQFSISVKSSKYFVSVSSRIDKGKVKARRISFLGP